METVQKQESSLAHEVAVKLEEIETEVEANLRAKFAGMTMIKQRMTPHVEVLRDTRDRYRGEIDTVLQDQIPDAVKTVLLTGLLDSYAASMCREVDTVVRHGTYSMTSSSGASTARTQARYALEIGRSIIEAIVPRIYRWRTKRTRIQDPTEQCENLEQTPTMSANSEQEK
jgi:hypothetical protein